MVHCISGSLERDPIGQCSLEMRFDETKKIDSYLSNIAAVLSFNGTVFFTFQNSLQYVMQRVKS